MKVGKYKITAVQILRIVSQVIFFILLPAIFISTFSGIKQIYLSIIHQNFNFTVMLPQLIEVFAIIPVTILIGRFFCGWMCAFGAMGDFTYMISSKLFKNKFKISEKADRILKFTKYIVLAFLIAYVWSFGVTTFSSSNPWDAFGLLLTVGKAPDISYVLANLAPALLIFVFIVAGSFFIERFFCRYLCPLGAVFGIVSKMRITSIQKNKTKCGKCRICTNSCPMGLPLYQKDSFKSGECIQCFKCVSACPRKNVSLAVSESDVRPVLAGAMAVTVMTGIYYMGSFAANTVAVSPTTASQVNTGSAVSNKIYHDGTYTGTGTGFRGATTTVSVTVKSDKITAVNIISYGDDAQFFNAARPTVIQSIISAQTATVDAVSGATYSSNGIMQAVSNALSSAKISQSNAKTASGSTSSQSDAGTSSTGNVTLNNNQNTASSAVLSSKYKDGTYRGSGNGYRGSTTTVSVTVSSGKISDVSVISTGDDKPFFNRAYPTVIQSIISNGSTNVDTVSGATFSSKGIIQAVADALNKSVQS
jgi:uncharacterized protein with FMN-binding domain/ferredoxin